MTSEDFDRHQAALAQGLKALAWLHRATIVVGLTTFSIWLAFDWRWRWQVAGIATQALLQGAFWLVSGRMDRRQKLMMSELSADMEQLQAELEHLSQAKDDS